MQRRQFLTAVGAGTAGVGTAGCADFIETRPARRGWGEPPVVEERPDAVYVPTHRDGMEVIGTGQAGDYNVGLMYSFPHRFWIVTGSGTERVDPRENDDVHLMATIWDEETETVLPVEAGLSMEVEREGEFITERSPWPMLSQKTGFHYGDNVALDGDGTYTVRVSVGGMNVPRFGAMDGTFEEGASTEIEFDYSGETRDDLEVELLEDRQGALDPVEMETMPTSTVPAPDELPGRVFGEVERGDARFVVSAVEERPFSDDGSGYLLVSPRTPYNRNPLPTMSLSVSHERDSSRIYDGSLQAAIEPEVGYHYGVGFDSIESGDSLTVAVDSPPQAARHEGYETAFGERSAIELTVE